MDFKKGIDKSDTAGDRTLVDGVKLNFFFRDEKMRGFEFRKDQENIRKKHKEKTHFGTDWTIASFKTSKLPSYVSVLNLFRFRFGIYDHSQGCGDFSKNPSLIHRSFTVTIIFNLRNSLLYFLESDWPTVQVLGIICLLFWVAFFAWSIVATGFNSTGGKLFSLVQTIESLSKRLLSPKKRLGKLNKNTHCFFHD